MSKGPRTVRIEVATEAKSRGSGRRAKGRRQAKAGEQAGSPDSALFQHRARRRSIFRSRVGAAQRQHHRRGRQGLLRTKGRRVPKSWSQLATNVVVQKYFRGAMGTPTRALCPSADWPRRLDDHRLGSQRRLLPHRTDADVLSELTHLLIHQKMAFNSPVWFNVGVEAEPQCSACFINSVKDTMDSILTLAKTEGHAV